LPKQLPSGYELEFGNIWGLHHSQGNRPTPNTWGSPVSSNVDGIFTVEWKGEADLRPQWCSFVASMSSGPATGLLLDGKRTYNCTGGNGMFKLFLKAMAQPLTSLNVWTPDIGTPQQFQQSVRDCMVHPIYLKHLKTKVPSFDTLRFMDLFETNMSPVKEWSERTSPLMASWHTVLADRSGYKKCMFW
jgi:hypothetical protein